jgi:hypothetical protein
MATRLPASQRTREFWPSFEDDCARVSELPDVSPTDLACPSRLLATTMRAHGNPQRHPPDRRA